MKRVVITGLGAITPIGKNTKEYWNNLLNEVSGANRITRYDASKFKTQFACEIKDFEALNYFDRKEARQLERFNQYGLISSEDALKAAESDSSQLDTNRIGVISSIGIGGFETFY